PARYSLVTSGSQVHLDAAGLGIEARLVLECVKDEVGIEFAVHSRQQVSIEGGGDPERIIVSADQSIHGLFEIGAQQQRVARIQDEVNLSQEGRVGGMIE